MTLGRSKPSSRGAVSNPTGRFEPLRYAPLEEGREDSGDEAPPLRTTVTFAIACTRLGLSLDAPLLDTTRFRVPPDPEGRQRSLFACLPTDGRRDTLP